MSEAVCMTYLNVPRLGLLASPDVRGRSPLPAYIVKVADGALLPVADVGVQGKDGSW